ncbi:MAG: hypothetical protein Q4C95_03575 [Planctomycetia bacterium]|nr:hypothetical protein [Planctomycetia bacterium]
MKTRFRHHSRQSEINQDGQDSFLDIVSNVVGILIILVMIAGVQVRAVHPESSQKNKSELNEDSSLTVSPLKEKESIEEKKTYIQITNDFEKIKEKVLTVKNEVEELNTQLMLVRQEADGADADHKNLIDNIAKLEASIELESKKLDQSLQTVFELNQEINRQNQEKEQLQRTKDSLTQNRPKATVLENVPTPLSKKVEGHEGYFRLKNGRISHVPMNVFVERVRGYFQNYRDIQNTEIDQTIGPIEQYSFRFLASLHQSREKNEIELIYRFDYGECLPTNDEIGESFEMALKPDSQFRKKLSLYLRESSTITLFVYPDSFALLRDIKAFLIKNNYSIAVRPLAMNQPIAISPDGTKSVAY